MTAAVTRTVTRLEGRIAAIQVEPQEGPCQLIARVEGDGAIVDAVFMGRRVIPGIEPGTRLAIEGMLTEHGGFPCIFNPRYELL